MSDEKLDATTERLIGMLHSSCGNGPNCDACASYVKQLRQRIRTLVEEARNEHIGEMTHVDYDDD